MKALGWFDSSGGQFNLCYNTSPQSLAAFRRAIAANTYQPNIYGALDQSPIPPPAQVVPPPAAATATATASVAPATPTPVSQNSASGPPPGSIQIVDALTSKAIPGATLVYASGVTTKTDINGLAWMPAHDPRPVLKQIVIGSVIIGTQLLLDPQHGYQLQVGLVTRQLVRILVHVVVDPWPPVMQIALLVPLVLIMTGIISVWSVRRRRHV